MDIFGLYPRVLETRDNKQIPSDTLAERVEVVLKNNIFEFWRKEFQSQKEWSLHLLMLFFSWQTLRKNVRKFWKETNDLVERNRYVFFISEHGEESLKVFREQVDMFQSIINFTAEHSKEEVSFLDVNIKLIDGELTDTCQFLDPTSCHPYHYKKWIPYRQALIELTGFTEFAQITKTLLGTVMSNDLEKCLMKRGYNGKMKRKQI